MSRTELGERERTFQAERCLQEQNLRWANGWCELEILSSSGTFQGRPGAQEADLVEISQATLSCNLGKHWEISTSIFLRVGSLHVIKYLYSVIMICQALFYRYQGISSSQEPHKADANMSSFYRWRNWVHGECQRHDQVMEEPGFEPRPVQLQSPYLSPAPAPCHSPLDMIDCNSLFLSCTLLHLLSLLLGCELCEARNYIYLAHSNIPQA